GEGQDDPPEGREFPRSVDAGGLLELLRDRLHKLRHEEDAGGGRNVRQDDGGRGVDQVEPGQHDELRDHGHLQRDHQGGEDRQEENVPAWKLETRERVARHRAKEDVEHHNGHRKPEAVQEPAREEREELPHLDEVVRVLDLGKEGRRIGANLDGTLERSQNRQDERAEREATEENQPDVEQDLPYRQTSRRHFTHSNSGDN